MRKIIVMVCFWGGYLLQHVGGVVLFGLLIYGIYIFFATSMTFGLMLIGVAVMGGWIIQIVSGLLMTLGLSAVTIGVKKGG